MSYATKLRKAIQTAQALVKVYNELKAVPGNESNPALDNERKWAQHWLDALQAEPSPSDIKVMWRDVRAIAKILDVGFKPERLSSRKFQLSEELFEAVEDLLRELGEDS